MSLTLYDTVYCSVVSDEALTPIGWAICMFFFVLTCVVYNYMSFGTTLRRAFAGGSDDMWKQDGWFQWIDVFLFDFLFFTFTVALFIAAVVSYADQNWTYTAYPYGLSKNDVLNVVLLFSAMAGLMVQKCVKWYLLTEYGSTGAGIILEPSAKEMYSNYFLFFSLFIPVVILSGISIFPAAYGYTMSGPNQNHSTCANETIQHWYVMGADWPLYQSQVAVANLVAGVFIALALIFHVFKPIKYAREEVEKQVFADNAAKTAWVDDTITETLSDMVSFQFSIFCDGEGPEKLIAVVWGWIPAIYLRFPFVLAFVFVNGISMIYVYHDLLKFAAYWVCVPVLALILCLFSQTTDYFYSYFISCLYFFMGTQYVIVAYLHPIFASTTHLAISPVIINWGWFLSGPADNFNVDQWTVTWMTYIGLGLATAALMLTAFGVKN